MRSMSTATEQTLTKPGIVTLTQKLQPNLILFVSARYKPPYTRVSPDIGGVLMVWLIKETLCFFVNIC
jgi:hypothetical protein